jgi:hypothetical protein
MWKEMDKRVKGHQAYDEELERRMAEYEKRDKK